MCPGYLLLMHVSFCSWLSFIRSAMTAFVPSVVVLVFIQENLSWSVWMLDGCSAELLRGHMDASWSYLFTWSQLLYTSVSMMMPRLIPAERARKWEGGRERKTVRLLDTPVSSFLNECWNEKQDVTPRTRAALTVSATCVQPARFSEVSFKPFLRAQNVPCV